MPDQKKGLANTIHPTPLQEAWTSSYENPRSHHFVRYIFQSAQRPASPVQSCQFHIPNHHISGPVKKNPLPSDSNEGRKGKASLSSLFATTNHSSSTVPHTTAVSFVVPGKKSEGGGGGGLLGFESDVLRR